MTPWKYLLKLGYKTKDRFGYLAGKEAFLRTPLFNFIKPSDLGEEYIRAEKNSKESFGLTRVEGCRRKRKGNVACSAQITQTKTRL